MLNIIKKIPLIVGKETLTIIVPTKDIQNLIDLGNCDFVECTLTEDKIIIAKDKEGEEQK